MASVHEGSFASPSADATPLSLPVRSQGFSAQLLGNLSAWNILVILLLGIIVIDQARYIWHKGSIAGSPLKIPFMGPFLEAIYPDFEKYKAKWNSGELSCVSVFHKFVVIASTRDLARKVFNSPMFVKPCVVDVAHKLLRPDNWVFLDGRAHVDYRKGLNGLFTRSALQKYLPGQEEIYDRYFAKFIDISQQQHGGKPIPFMPVFREMQCAVAMRTFVGHYMPDSSVKKIADEYYKITAALDLVNFPWVLPFSRPWYGKKASDLVLDEFAKCSAMSKIKMATGAEPECILDFWVRSIQDSQKYLAKKAQGIEIDPAQKPAQILREFSDLEISMTLFTFLFASQDATSSANTWLFQLLADRPEVLDRVRAENLEARNGDRDAPVTLELIEKLPFTRAVVKETLRYRPPVIMVPYVAKKDYPITENYTVRKGSMVVPSVYPATHDPVAYPNPDYWDPDRWITGNAEDQTKNWLVFGTGPHYCLGQTYAQNNLIAMIGKASLHLDWQHQITPKSEVVKVFATIFPMDDCLLSFQPRPA